MCQKQEKRFGHYYFRTTGVQSTWLKLHSQRLRDVRDRSFVMGQGGWWDLVGGGARKKKNAFKGGLPRKIEGKGGGGGASGKILR